MKKSVKIVLGVYIVIGAALLVIGLKSEIEYYSSLIFAMGVALLANSIGQLVRVWYYSRPGHREAYQEKQKKQRIDLKDERKMQLRNRAGYLTWAAAMAICLAGSFLAALLRAGSLITGLLFGEAVLLYLAATVIYKYLCKKC